jgi:RNA polymerase sigma-70 factor (ECF subfamily)
VAEVGKEDLTTRGRFSKEAMLHLDHLYRVSFHLAKDQSEAQDLVQETFARAFAAYDQFKPGTNMKAWLTKILHNFFLDRYHRRNRWVSADDPIGQKFAFGEESAAENLGPESLVLFRELSSQIADALRKIPEEFRASIVLVDMSDFSYEEAAEILSCPIGTIRSRLSRGRRLLRQHLKNYIGVKKNRG